jgi:hypothetical protein
MEIQMEKENFEYLKLQYEEGARIIRYWIECRYKILQFVGYFNAAVLTFGFSQGVLLSPEKAFAGLAICLLSIFVALMGLATEFSTTSYNYGYFEALRKIEEKFQGYDTPGIITHSRDTIIGSRFHKVLPVHRAHKIFYVFLIVFWIVLLIYQARLVLCS